MSPSDTDDAVLDPSEEGYFADDAATFGDRLVAAREAVGLTQTALAARLGVLPRTLRNWEEDRADPRANKLQMLSGVLNVSMLWLLSGEGDGVASADPGTADLREVLTDLRAIRAEHRRLGEKMARLEKRLRGLEIRHGD